MSIHMQMISIYANNVDKIENRQELIKLIIKEISKRNKYISKDEVIFVKNFCDETYKKLNHSLNACKCDEKMMKVITKEFDKIDTFSDCVKELEDGKHIEFLPWNTYAEKKMNDILKELLNFIGIDSAETIYLMAMNESIYAQAFIYIKEKLHKFMKDCIMISNPNHNEYYILQIDIYSQLTFVHRWMKDNNAQHLKKSKMISFDEFKTKFDEIYKKDNETYIDQISKEASEKFEIPQEELSNSIDSNLDI